MSTRPPAPERRRRPILRGALLAACAAVALASAAAWLRSRSTLDMVTHTGGRLRAPSSLRPDWVYERITWGAFIAPGSLRLSRSTYTSISPVEPDTAPWTAMNGWRTAHIPRSSFRDHETTFARSILDFRIAGLGFYRTARSGEITRTLQAPFWLLIAAAAATPSIMLARTARRRRRIRTGRCPRCGYILPNAAAPCPECGGPPAR